jgi:hypothetical protein
MNSIGIVVWPARPVVWKFLFLAVVVLLIAVLVVSPAFAAATTFRQNIRQPLDIYVFVPCAAGGAGEYVHLTGTLHVLFITTLDGNGGFHTKFHNQPQGVSGYGEITGAKYQGTGVTQGTFNGRVGFEVTDINNFRIIGQGPGNNFMIHETFHLTVRPDGTVTAFVDNFSVTCKAASYP